MLPFENRHCLHGRCVPDVYGWVSPDLSGGHVVVSGMESQAEDVISVGGVESLLVGGACVDHTQRCNVIDYVTIFGVEEVVATVVTTVTVRSIECYGVYVQES